MLLRQSLAPNGHIIFLNALYRINKTMAADKLRASRGFANGGCG
jgi:hypothetical protein